MSYIKIPSWLELVKLLGPLGRFGIMNTYNMQPEASFWKEQALRFGFDIREALGLHVSDIPWQSFFYETFFKYTLKRINNNLQNLKSWEKQFWKRNGRFVERLELTGANQQDIEELLDWFPNVQHLVLKKCNTLLQSDTVRLQRLLRLNTLEIQDVHLLSDKAFANIPKTIQRLIIHSPKSITNEFFNELHTLPLLSQLAIVHCHSLQQNHLCKLPATLCELDLSGSGSTIVADACLYLPRSLVCVKMNRWDHFTDKELTLLPPNLHTLEIEGWKIEAEGLNMLSAMPLEELSLARTSCDSFYDAVQCLPQSLRKLNLSQNTLTGHDLASLARLHQLVELDLSFTQGYDGGLDDAQVAFPKKLKKLNLAYSGLLHKKSIQPLNQLTHLNLAGCNVENSDLEWLPKELVELDLSLSSQITDVGLNLLSRLSHLCRLVLDGCEEIRGFGIVHLAKTLKKLSLAGCHRLSGKSLVELPIGLEELNLDSCELVMLDDICNLPYSLQWLNLSRCIHIGNEACDILSSLPLLNTISLQGCPKVTEEAIAKLVRRKFEGTIIIKSDLPIRAQKKEDDIELHPPVSILKKLTNFKARLIHKLKTQGT